MTALIDLAGSYTLHPGVSASITGQRPLLGPGLLSRVLRGRGVDQVEQSLGQLFSLCGHAHRRVARLAIHAAQCTALRMLPQPPSQALAFQTALDHLRSMATDWPYQGTGWSVACPVSLAPTSVNLNDAQGTDGLRRLQDWLEHRVLQQTIADWIGEHRTPEALLAWCHRHGAAVPPAQFLVDCYPLASALQIPCKPLDVLDQQLEKQTLNLHQLALAIGDQPNFSQQPRWHGQCVETGAWTRLRHLQTETGSGIHTSGGMNAWTRLASRWCELVELCADEQTCDTSALGLSSGALALGQGQALGWCEMARGLLLHWVQLDSQGQVQTYQVVAPTEWNFHREGALARALTQLAPEDAAGASLLGKAFDACVDCQVSPVPSSEPFNA